MALIVISIDRNKLPKHTDEEFEEWIRFEVGDTPHMSYKSPLHDCDIEAKVKEISK